MASDRWRARRAVTAASVAAALVGGCQLVSGLSGLHEGSTGAGGATGSTSSAGSTGGATASSASTGASSTASTTSTTGTTTTSSSSGGGGAGGGCACGGGPCMGAVCTPYVVVADPGGTPTTLASDGTYVYWGIPGMPLPPATGKIQRQKIGAPEAPELVVPSIYPSQIRVDGTSCYWNDQQANMNLMGIARRAADGMGPIDHVFPVQAGAPAVGLELRFGRLSWGVPSQKTVDFGPATAANLSVPTSLDTGTPSTFVAADGTAAYFAESTGIYKRSFAPDPDAGAPMPLAATGNVTGLVADAHDVIGRVYFSTPSAIFSVLKAGGTPLIPYTGTPDGQLVVDDQYVYFTSSTGNSCSSAVLMKAPIVPGTAKNVQHLTGCSVLAQDAQNLFWTDGGQIWRVVKQ